MINNIQQNQTDNKQISKQLNKINKNLTNYNNENINKQIVITQTIIMKNIDSNIRNIQSEINDSILITNVLNKIDETSNGVNILKQQTSKSNQLNIEYIKLQNDCNELNSKYIEYIKLKNDFDNMSNEFNDITYKKHKLSLDYSYISNSIEMIDIHISHNQRVKTFKINKEVALQSELIKTTLECDANRTGIFICNAKASFVVMQNIIYFMNYHYQTQSTYER